MTAGYALLQHFLRETSGITLDDDKSYLVEDKLQPVLRAENLKSLLDLANRLHVAPRSDLARSVVEALTINETSFFRDKTLFSVFADRLLPDLIKAREEAKRLRIWCAGCSTGQEPYSLAMLVDEHMRRLSGWQVEIVATDLSRPVIETAKRGLYSQFEVQRGLPISMLLRHFVRQDAHWLVNDYLKARVAFRTHNLLAPTPESAPFDIIFCRNVLIYFNVANKRRVLENLAGALAEGGQLVLGAAETVSGLSQVLRPDDTRFVFRKDRGAALSGIRSLSA